MADTPNDTTQATATVAADAATDGAPAKRRARPANPGATPRRRKTATAAAGNPAPAVEVAAPPAPPSGPVTFRTTTSRSTPITAADGPLTPLAVRFFPGHQETIAGAEGMIVTKRLITPWKSPDDKALIWLLECQGFSKGCRSS